jgi:hypothetical protein
LYVARVEYHPGIVALSVQASPVPVAANVSKFSVRGTPNAVMLPPLVSANVRVLMSETSTAMPITAVAIATATGRTAVESCRMDVIGFPRRF